MRMELKEIVQILLIERVNSKSLSWDGGNKCLALKRNQSLTHRHDAYPKLVGKLFQDELVARLVRAGQDRVTDSMSHLICQLRSGSERGELHLRSFTSKALL
jgi:hypothetical protein